MDTDNCQPDLEVIKFLESCGVKGVTPERLSTLSELRVLMAQRNRQTNLTRVVDPDGFWIKHVADSLAVVRFLPQLADRRLVVADVGCGAGFPLLPLAWAFPDLHLRGIDPKHRRVDFINECCRRFAWSNCNAIALQAREAGRTAGLSASFDIVLSRAFADAAKVLRECRGLVKPGGTIAVYKTSAAVAKENDAAQREAGKFAFNYRETPALALPAGSGERRFIIFSKS